MTVLIGISYCIVIFSLQQRTLSLRFLSQYSRKGYHTPHQSLRPTYARKIDLEDAELNSKSDKSNSKLDKRYDKPINKVASSNEIKSSENKSIDRSSNSAISPNITKPENANLIKTIIQQNEYEENEHLNPEKDSSIEMENIFDNPLETFLDSSSNTIKVPRSDPLQSSIPPEIVFFGDPRRPPPFEASRELQYHGSLLFWARHGSVAPQTSEDRLRNVFPKGRLDPTALTYRLEPRCLTYSAIVKAFRNVSTDLQRSKDFIRANIDIIPPKLFLRAITAQKLSFQSTNDMENMLATKDLRNKYILAHDQVFFPMHIEILKAETRVMTYLARDELKGFASSWDEVEATLHFVTILAARLTWDDKVNEVLRDIKQRVDRTIAYMSENIRSQLMDKNFRRPAVTAEVYLNASMKIQNEMPRFFRMIRPEVRALHETYFMKDSGEMKKYILQTFCPANKVSPELIRENLKVLDACLASIEGLNYRRLRIRTRRLFEALCEPQDLFETDKWYMDFFENGYGFETYEPDPDDVPTIIRAEQRIRDTGNAFSNFQMEVLGGPTKFTDAFSGKRPRASEVGKWLERDPDYLTKLPQSYEERIRDFQAAYAEQLRLRSVAEGTLEGLVNDRLTVQDRILRGESANSKSSDSTSSVITFKDE